MENNINEEEKIEKVIDEMEDSYEELSVEERIINIEKKTNITFVLIIITLIVALLTMILVINDNGGTSNQSQESQESVDTTYDVSKFEPIKGSEIKSESKGKTIVVLIGRQGCGYCAAYAPLITDVAEKNNVTIRYIDFTDMVDLNTGTITDEKSYNAIKNLEGDGIWEGFGEKAVSGTPYTLIIKNNKVISGVAGAGKTETIVDAFKEVGLIK